MILKNLINTPKTKGYLDPNCSTEYKKYCKFNTLREIESDIKTNFKFPTIVKPNRGSGGKGVAKCNTQTELEQVLELVYNQANKDYDYIALVQEFIEIKKEYRVFCVNGAVELIYLKDNSQSTFIGNLSPLHWEGSKAVLISDLGFRNQVQSFVNPIFQKLNIFWCGLDIVIDQNNIMSLIEINTNPGLTIFLEQNDEQIVYNLYKTGLSKYFQSLNLLNREINGK